MTTRRKVNTTVVSRASALTKAKKFGVKFREFIDGLGDHLVERDEVLEAVAYALLTKHHVMLIGTHGIAKSMLGNKVFGAFKDASLFEVQLHQFTTTDALFGIPNIKLMEQEGRIQYNVEGMLPEANFAFLEEIFDASGPLLRTLLDILNERQFRTGSHVLKGCPLKTAIATSNFYDTGDELAAVLDRFLIHVNVDPISDLTNVVSMLNNVLTPPPSKDVSFSLQELDNFHAGLDAVRIPEELVDLYVDFIDKFVQESGSSIYVSDRRKVWGLSVLRAAALLRGGSVVDVEDFSSLKYVLTLVGKLDHAQWFSSTESRVLDGYRETRKFHKGLPTIKRALTSAMERASDLDQRSQEEQAQVCEDLQVILNTLVGRDCSHDGSMTPKLLKEYKSLQQEVAELLRETVTRVAANLRAAKSVI